MGYLQRGATKKVFQKVPGVLCGGHNEHGSTTPIEESGALPVSGAITSDFVENSVRERGISAGDTEWLAGTESGSETFDWLVVFNQVLFSLVFWDGWLIEEHISKRV